MSKTVVTCSECGKQLLYTEYNPDTERGKIAHEVMSKGYIYKLPFLFGHYRVEFFCCKECKDKWFDKIPADVREKGNAVSDALSKKWKSEEFQEGLRDGLARISNLYHKFKKR